MAAGGDVCRHTNLYRYPDEEARKTAARLRMYDEVRAEVIADLEAEAVADELPPSSEEGGDEQSPTTDLRQTEDEEAEATRRYETALAAGLSDHEAREEGWPTKPAEHEAKALTGPPADKRMKRAPRDK